MTLGVKSTGPNVGPPSPGERSLHTGEVAGSIPAAPTILLCFSIFPLTIHDHLRPAETEHDQNRQHEAGEMCSPYFRLLGLITRLTNVGLAHQTREPERKVSPTRRVFNDGSGGVLPP